MASTSLNDLFVERYRPKSLADVLLVERLRRSLENYKDGNILLYSPPGMGKTTVARILTAGTDKDVLLINGSKENGVETIRNEVTAFCQSMSFTGNKKFVMIEECDGLSEQAWNALRAVIEESHEVVRFIGTCNYIERIPAPIRSRFTCINFAPLDEVEKNELRRLYEGRVKWVLDSLGVVAENETIKKIVARNFPDMRSIFNEVEFHVNSLGTDRHLNAGLAQHVTWTHLFAVAMSGDVDPVRNYKYTLVEEQQVENAILAFSKHFPEYFVQYARDKNELAKLPNIIITIADAQRDIRTVPDKIIALSAMILKIQLTLCS